MRQKLNIVTLGVNDLSKSVAFYEDSLKWKRSDASTENIVFFNLGGIVLALYPKDKLVEDVTLKFNMEGTSPITLAYNAKTEQEVDDLLFEVKNLGAEIIKPAQKVFWGGYSGYFKDLDGNLFEVAFNPFVTFDENDNLMI